MPMVALLAISPGVDPNATFVSLVHIIASLDGLKLSALISHADGFYDLAANAQ